MQLATTVSIPVVRNPVAMAKTLSSIDHLSAGKLIIGVETGSIHAWQPVEVAVGETAR